MTAWSVDHERRDHVTDGRRKLEAMAREAGGHVKALGADAIEKTRDSGQWPSL